MEIYQKLLVFSFGMMFTGMVGIYLIVTVMESDLVDPRKVLPRMIAGQLMVLCGVIGFLGTIATAILRMVEVL